MAKRQNGLQRPQQEAPVQSRKGSTRTPALVPITPAWQRPASSPGDPLEPVKHRIRSVHGFRGCAQTPPPALPSEYSREARASGASSGRLWRPTKAVGRRPSALCSSSTAAARHARHRRRRRLSTVAGRMAVHMRLKGAFAAKPRSDF